MPISPAGRVMRNAALPLLLVLAACGTRPAAAESAAAESAAADVAAAPARPAAHQASTVRVMAFGGREWYVVEADLARDRVQVHWKDDAGRPYGSPSALADALHRGGDTVVAVINGGIFRDLRPADQHGGRARPEDYAPMGLHVERGRQAVALNTDAGRGNFFDTGAVFAVLRDGTARIYPRSAVPRGRLREAVQSGPQLVVRGRSRAPGYRNSSPTRRTAVGVCSPTRVVFAVSRTDATLADAARLFAEGLGCRDALFLDGGGVRALVAPADGIRIEENVHGPFAGMIAVVRGRGGPAR